MKVYPDISEQQRVRGRVHLPRAEGPVRASGVPRPVRVRLSHLQQHRPPGPHGEALPLQPGADQETDGAGGDLESLQGDQAGGQTDNFLPAPAEQLHVQLQAGLHPALPLTPLLLPFDVPQLLRLLLPALLPGLQLLLQSHQADPGHRARRELHPHGEPHQTSTIF